MMNMNSFTAPPVNNALQPDIYNKLDAEVIERTRVANNQLAMRLLLEEKIITKYRNEAERIISLEKSRVAQELNRISQTLPAVARIRNFDDQFFPKGPVSSSGARNKRKKKNYLAEKNDDVICQRCYIHHMPLKNKFYKRVSPPSSPTVFDSNVDKDPAADYVAVSAQAAEPEHVDPGSARQKSSKSRLGSAYNDSYRFLDKNLYGRNQDLNDTLTPRLMPNELWKKVVNNVCSQCLKREKTLAARLDRSGYSRERTVGFDRLASRGSKPRVDSRAPTRSSSYLSRSNSQRQLKSRGELQSLSMMSSVLGKIPEPSQEKDGAQKSVSRDLSLTERCDTATSVKESRKRFQEK